MKLLNKNILFVLGGTSEPTKGGVSRVCDNLTKPFSVEGASVYIISSDNSYIGNYKDSWIFPSPKVTDIANSNFLLNLQNQYKFNYVIIEDPQEAWVISAVECLKGRTFLIGHLHNSPFGLYSYVSRLKPQFLADSKIIRNLVFYKKRKAVKNHYKKVSNLLDKLVLLSDRYESELYKLAEFRPEQVIAIPNPFPQIDYKDHKKNNTILFVGRIANPQKRVFALLDIWKRLAPQLPDWDMKIVGEGPQLKECKAKAQKMRLERISFEGHQVPDKYYNDSKLFVMTSLYEGFPMTLVEAMQYKCVPIAFDSFAALSEILDEGNCGLLVPSFSEKLFTSAVMRLALDNDKLSEMASNCRNKSIQYAPSLIADKWISLFNDSEILVMR